ncbi:MAG: hypothetical protein ACK5MK_01685, partial [Dysgonomonas sp.]
MISVFSTTFYFPCNSTIPSRGLLIVSYRYPYSTFRISDLFPSIASDDSRILYQSNIILYNRGEEITLYDNNGILIDRMSYKEAGIVNTKSYWDLAAVNGSYKGSSFTRLFSIQRHDIHATFTAITPLAADYETTDATPLQTLRHV